MKCSIALFALVTGLVAACDDTTPTTPESLNYDRPVDMAFACYGGLRITNGGAPDPTQTVETQPQPTQACDIRSLAYEQGSPPPLPPGQEDLTSAGGQLVPSVQWYTYILNSESGTVTLASFPTEPSSSFAGADLTQIDADALTPGQNGIAVGENPVAIATDSVGCYEVTANGGSCDLSALENNSTLLYVTSSGSPNPRVDRLGVTSSTGQPVKARPAAMVGQPPTGTIGVECGPQPTGLMYVAYPGCHLVAAVDVSSGTVVGGIQFDASGVPTMLPDGNVSCPDECNGGAVVPGTRPVTVDLQLDPTSGRRVLAIGADNSAALTYVELGPDYLPQSVQQLVLQDPKGTLGVTTVKVTPQIGMGGSGGVINDTTALGGQSQFIYAVATDGTVRVADILNLRKECDTQVDPRFLYTQKNVKTLSCMPVGDAATPPRRPGARGPGIQLIGASVPTSVDVFKVDPIIGDTRLPGDPTRLIGYFAVISAADGSTYIANIDNDDFADFVNPMAPIGTEIPLDIAHQLRDAIPDRGALAQTSVAGVASFVCDNIGPDPDTTIGNDAGPREVDDPVPTVPDTTISAAKVGSIASIRKIECVGSDELLGVPLSELAFAAPVAVRDLEFPDLLGLRTDETWTLTWEGSLSTDLLSAAVDGPQIREGQMFSDATDVQLVDQTGPFCDAGVEPYDIVQLRGCDPSLGDADCPLGYTCFVHPDSQVAGLGACMLTSEAGRLADACKEYLISLRRYTVGKATSGELVMLPRQHELITSPVDGCTTDAQCQLLGSFALTNADSANPIDDRTPPDMHTYTCAVDPARKAELDPSGAPLKRCVQTCVTDTDCDAGTVCQTGTCMEGIVPPQSCINAPQRYEVRASEAYTVIGTLSGYVHPIIADAGGNCVKDPNASPWSIGRIPLHPLDPTGALATCDPTTDPRTNKKADGTFDNNPCQMTVTQTEYDNNYIPGTCTVGSPATTLVSRSTQGVVFHGPGMTLTMVDPTYPGDAICIGDRGGTLGNIPIVTPGLQWSFRQTAGFSPELLQITPALPIKVVHGPTESIWVIDEGDFLSTSVTEASTRGKVFRVESSALSVVNTLQ